MYSTPSPESVERLLSRLRAAGLPVVAQINVNDRARDFVVAISPNSLAVVRYGNRPSAQDVAQLHMMVSQRDFVWGGLVCQRDDEVEQLDTDSFRVTEFDRLVARLSQLREAYHEAH